MVCPRILLDLLLPVLVLFMSDNVPLGGGFGGGGLGGGGSDDDDDDDDDDAPRAMGAGHIGDDDCQVRSHGGQGPPRGNCECVDETPWGHDGNWLYLMQRPPTTGG